MGSLSMSSAVRLWLVSVDARADGMTSVTWTDSASRPGSISTLTPTIPPELHSRCVGSALEPIQHELDVVETWWEPQKLEGPGGARYRDPLALKGVRSQGDRDTWQREPLRVVGGPPHGACLTPLCKGLRRGGE